MRRRIANFILIVLFFVVEKSVFPFISYIKSSPNLLLLITFTLAFAYGEREGIYCGLLCGFLMDMFSDVPLGFYTIIFILIGYLIGFFSEHYNDNHVLLPVLLCTASTLMYNVYVYLFRFMVQGKTDFMEYLIKIILPEIAITAIMALILCQPILVLNRELKKLDDKKKGMKVA